MLAAVMTLSVTSSTAFAARYPSWWSQHNVLDTTATETNDFVAATAGQLKWITEKARNEIADYGGDTTQLDALIATFSNGNDYAAVNCGQLKYVASILYNRLIEMGYTNAYPWTDSPTDNDYAIANVGQIKHIFSFDLEFDSDEDGMPDWWEILHGLDPNDPADAASDLDNDDMSNLWEYINGFLPSSASDAVEDRDGDGYLNVYECVHGSDPSDSFAFPSPTVSLVTTIQAAIDSATTPYDIVGLPNGSYSGIGNMDLEFRGKAIMVTSIGGPAQCCIDPQGEGGGFWIHENEDSRSVLHGVSVVNGRLPYAGVGIFISSAPTIINCHIADCESYYETGIDGGYGAGVYVGGNAALNRLVISNCTAELSAGGVYCESGASPNISNCLIIENKVTGQTEDVGAGAVFRGNAVTENTTFLDNGSASSSGNGVHVDNGDPVFRNCIIWGEETSQFTVDQTAAPQITYSVVKNGYPGEGNLSLSPMFVLGHHLHPDSPCVDAGGPGTIPSRYDIDGENRILDGSGDDMSVIDIGADEFWDSDGDTLPDVWEDAYGLDSSNPDGEDGQHGDPDGEGVDNSSELRNHGNPNDADTDNDGLSDAEELILGTLLAKADTDGDGLSDGDEVNTHGTDPKNSDTDGDGFSDYDEVHTYESNPNEVSRSAAIRITSSCGDTYFVSENVGDGDNYAFLSDMSETTQLKAEQGYHPDTAYEEDSSGYSSAADTYTSVRRSPSKERVRFYVDTQSCSEEGDPYEGSISILGGKFYDLSAETVDEDTTVEHDFGDPSDTIEWDALIRDQIGGGDGGWVLLYLSYVVSPDMAADLNDDGRFIEGDPAETTAPGLCVEVSSDAEDRRILKLRQLKPVPEDQEITVTLSVNDQSMLRIYDQNGTARIGPSPSAATYTIPYSGIASQDLDYEVEGVSPGEVTVSLICKTLDGDEIDRDEVKITIIKVDLNKVSFSGTDNHTLKSDDQATTFSAPHYLDSNLDGDADDTGEHSYPVCYTRNKKMKVAAEFTVSSVPSGASIKVKGDGPGNVDIPPTVATVNGSTITLPATEASSAFPDEVDFVEPMTISWSVSFDGGSTWFDAGDSTNTLYVTWAAPEQATPIQTFVHVGCEAADGQSGTVGTDDDDILAAVWGAFAGLTIQRASDDKVLTYYGYDDANGNGSYDSGETTHNDGNSCQWTSAEELVGNRFGQCTAWAKLMGEVMKAQGLGTINGKPSKLVRCEPLPAYDRVAIKNWTTAGNPAWSIINADAGVDGSSPATPAPGEASDAIGVAGQGHSPNPPALFLRHFIVKMNDEYYDPSYGGGAFTAFGDYESGSALFGGRFTSGTLVSGGSFVVVPFETNF